MRNRKFPIACVGVCVCVFVCMYCGLAWSPERNWLSVSYCLHKTSVFPLISTHTAHLIIVKIDTLLYMFSPGSGWGREPAWRLRNSKVRVSLLSTSEALKTRLWSWLTASSKVWLLHFHSNLGEFHIAVIPVAMVRLRLVLCVCFIVGGCGVVCLWGCVCHSSISRHIIWH